MTTLGDGDFSCNILPLFLSRYTWQNCKCVTCTFHLFICVYLYIVSSPLGNKDDHSLENLHIFTHSHTKLPVGSLAISAYHLCTIKTSHKVIKIRKMQIFLAERWHCSLADLRVIPTDFLYSPVNFFEETSLDIQYTVLTSQYIIFGWNGSWHFKVKLNLGRSWWKKNLSYSKIA